MIIYCIIKSILISIISFYRTGNAIDISGHSFIEKEHYLECEICGYKSWNAGEGFERPDKI
jgi:hypothetical protein